jgi:broad specificity phosphatase PhoE
MEIAGSVVKAAGLPWPDPQEVTDLDEFDAFTMMRVMAPVLIDIDPEIRMLSQAFEENRDTPEAGRLLQKFFEAACRKWASGDVETPPVETWAQFRQRIGNSIDNLRRTAEPSTSTVAFTSGGPIAATIGFVLDLTAAKAIEFVWLSRNCSWTQFLHSGERFSMHSFNAIPHLDDLSLFSYR